MLNWENPAPPTMRTIASICHCSSPHEHVERAEQRAAEDRAWQERDAKQKIEALKGKLAAATQTLRVDDYEIVRVEAVERHLVMQVKYPSCPHREFEGTKTMVFLDVSPIDALRWRQIDPHFRDTKAAAKLAAPSPAARFPGNDLGWNHACRYAEMIG